MNLGNQIRPEYIWQTQDFMEGTKHTDTASKDDPSIVNHNTFLSEFAEKSISNFRVPQVQGID